MLHICRSNIVKQRFIVLHYMMQGTGPQNCDSYPTVLVLLANDMELLTYLLTPWCRVPLEKLIDLQLHKKFPTLHGTRRFITALTSVRQLSLSWASPIQSIYPHHTSWRSILILSTHLRLGLPSGLLPSCFPTKTLYTPISSLICATCPAHLIFYCNTTYIPVDLKNNTAFESFLSGYFVGQILTSIRE